MVLYLFFRFAIPQAKIKSLSANDLERKFAELLFGKENLKNESNSRTAPNPLVLFCKDSDEEEFSGTRIKGFEFNFCNSTEIVQTDVGVCIGSNTRQHVTNGKIVQKVQSMKVDAGLKDVEHILVISVNEFGNYIHHNNFGHVKQKEETFEV